MRMLSDEELDFFSKHNQQVRRQVLLDFCNLIEQEVVEPITPAQLRELLNKTCNIYGVSRPPCDICNYYYADQGTADKPICQIWGNSYFDKCDEEFQEKIRKAGRQ